MRRLRSSPGPRRGPSWVAALLFIIGGALVPSVMAASLIYSSAFTTVLFGQPYLEFDNPLTGSEHVNGRAVLEWRDAGYSCSGAGPPDYEDWIESPPCTHCGCFPYGYVNEIWLLYLNSASTTTTVPGQSVSIHLHGDIGDGLTHVYVDGTLHASVDMNTSPGTDNVLIIVDNLPYTTHTILVENGGTGDTAIMGAAVLESPYVPAMPTWALGTLALAMLGMATLLLRRRKVTGYNTSI